jgi:hypothetical protein
MWIAERLWSELFSDCPFVIVSGVEGKHHRGSRHYLGLAGDIRTKDPQGRWTLTDEQRSHFIVNLRKRLGDEYDVTLSGQYKSVHLELDPKEEVR